jgi:CHAT domain
MKHGSRAPAATAQAKQRASDGITYQDFVIRLRRTDSRSVGVQVEASPAGRTARPVSVKYHAREAAQLRASFVSRPGSSGRMLMSMDDAAAIGERLALVLFPGPVFRLFAQSLGKVVRRANVGLRIRLDLDEALVDLPWEYTRRPDRDDTGTMSGFLLLDASISMIRQPTNPAISIKPIDGRQRLSFVGALWEGGEDGWEVRKEFDLLRQALKPVAHYIQPKFAYGRDVSAFKPKEKGEAAIFHYAGHCDFGEDGRGYMVRESSKIPARADKVYIDQIAPALARAGTRLALMSACNSGYWAMVGPLLDAGIPAVLGVNGAVASISTIEFCKKLYESLAVGLTLDEAVGRARLHIMEWGRSRGLFDWGLYMVYMPSAESTLFARARTHAVALHQKAIRKDHAAAVGDTRRLAKELDGTNFGELMSTLAERRVLILGRFTGRRLDVLKAIKARLEAHPNHYQAELFTFERPQRRTLVESIIGFAALSRFIVADLSEPRSVQAELQAIVPSFRSVPVVPLINQTGREYATFDDIRRRENVVQPTVRYRNCDDLAEKIYRQVVPLAEQMLSVIQPGG